MSASNFIGGQRSAAGSVHLQSLDARTGEALPGVFTQATPGEVAAAAEAAEAAFVEYNGMAPERRAQFLDAIADQLDALGDSFIATVCRETALPAARIQGERGRTSNQLRLFAKVLRRGDYLAARIDRAQPHRQPLPRPDLRQYRTGVGPVAVFGASNSPWRSPLPAATPQQRWPLAARWWSRRTAAIWPRPRRWARLSSGRRRRPACLPGCST